MKTDFISYINEHNKEGSQKASSYIRAIELLDEVLRTNAKDTLQGFNSIYDIVSIETISKLYDYVLEEQKNENGIFKDVEQSSYWRKGFFSAALKTYLDYLKNGTNVKKDNRKIWVEKTNNENPEVDMLDSFAKWFAKPTERHNYMNDYFSGSISKLKDSLLEYERVYEDEFGTKIFTFNKDNKDAFIAKLESNLYNQEGGFYELSKKASNHLPRAILGKNNYIAFLRNEYYKKEINQQVKNIPEPEALPRVEHVTQVKYIAQVDFDLSDFKSACDNSGLIYSAELLTRYAASLATKPFVLLTGLSGSGKTKLAQAFAQWICETEKQYCIVPVGADWTNREPLLGYVNALEEDKYIIPENGALKLIIEANKEGNEEKPYFLILDEMNLSHVERYFADFLSIMESDDPLKLHSSNTPLNGGDGLMVNKEYKWPNNLFVIGTVNIDETTYMFSPKVLDRANVIEFRISESDLDIYLKPGNGQLDMSKLCEENSKIGKGARYGESFVSIAKNREAVKENMTLNQELRKFFVELQKIGAEFGYRSASEIQVLFNKLDVINPDYSENINEKIDIAIMQKLLPKLHGSRSKLVPVLSVLAGLCYTKLFTKEEIKKIFDDADKYTEQVIYPISLEKITRMYNNVIDNGFTSYAEA